VLSPFKYFAPHTLSQASALLLDEGPRARALAGGTALLVALERAQTSVDAVINLKGIPGMRDISFDARQGLRVGALVTLTDLGRNAAVRAHYPLLIQAIDFFATPQVRNLATLGGSLCVAAPAGDLVVTCLALDAMVHIHGPLGERTLPVDPFLRTWGGTVLEPGELLTQIEIPLPHGGAHYRRFMVRAAVDVPLVNLAIALEQEKGVVSHARIVLGANGPRATRMPRAEQSLLQRCLDPAAIERTAAFVAEDAYPLDDLRASRAYRRGLIGVLTRRMLLQFAPRN
jgi:carbon-monoxide dehydrogenase medium subunit